MELQRRHLIESVDDEVIYTDKSPTFVGSTFAHLILWNNYEDYTFS